MRERKSGSDEALPYSTAIEKLKLIAQAQSLVHSHDREYVALDDAVGRIAAYHLISPISTPRFDTSAMDGYAIRSQATKLASTKLPTVFQIKGSIAAGDNPGKAFEMEAEDIEPCIEIMTGGIFPDCGSFDACVKVEDTFTFQNYRGKLGHFMCVSKPIPPNINRRLAGDDIPAGEVIVRQGDIIQSTHIMPLASVGFGSLSVLRRPLVGVYSTGKEFKSSIHPARDSNGPYLTSMLKEFGAEVKFLGILDDDPCDLENNLRISTNMPRFDVIITTGGVSAGRYDFVRKVLEQMGAEIIFHGLAIRPGHPVLFALMPSAGEKNTAIFGLPGNPVAAADIENPVPVRLQTEIPIHNSRNTSSHELLDLFRHGIMKMNSDGALSAEISEQQSPSKLRPFIQANCWIHVKDGCKYMESEVVDCYPMHPIATIS